MYLFPHIQKTFYKKKKNQTKKPNQNKLKKTQIKIK